MADEVRGQEAAGEAKGITPGQRVHKFDHEGFIMTDLISRCERNGLRTG